MTEFNFKAFADTVRAKVPIFKGRVSQANYDALVESIKAGLGQSPRTGRPVSTTEPKWLTEARSKIGLTEIQGPRHNQFIAQGWKRLGAGWFTDDETPWCGLFVAHCIEAAGLPFPKMFPRAKSWASWGKPSTACLGAVVVFGRSGGGHVGFLVGENSANYYVLGGNQRNQVNIMPIAKARLVRGGIRWPKGMANPDIDLPRMTGGIVSVNEA